VMAMNSENLTNGSAATQDRFAEPLTGYRPGRRDGGLAAGVAEPDLLPRNGGVPHLVQEPEVRPQPALPSLPSLDLGGLTEPVFDADAAADPAWPAASGSLVDHPLLRGLLMELPPKGSMPPPGWLDRWFEAARSILELLYLQESRPTR